jgi:hypothetical protein
MHADGFTIVPSSAAVGGDFVTIAISDSDAEFAMSLVWSRQTPPRVLRGLLEAADGAIAENGWHSVRNQ